jgi:hypothetical protein
VRVAGENVGSYPIEIGTSTRNGVSKIRLATDFGRKKVLEKTGNTNVVLHKLPEPMTKEAAHAYFKNHAASGLLPATE